MKLVMMRAKSWMCVAVLSLAACHSGAVDQNVDEEEFVDLERPEAQKDTAQLGEALQALYGPLEYKQERFSFRLPKLMWRAHWEVLAADSDAEVFSVWTKLLARLDDGHVSLSFIDNSSPVSARSVPCLVVPVEGAAVIAGCDPSVPAGYGDELLAIDGTPVDEIAAAIEPYLGWGNPDSERHFAYMHLLNRPFFMVDAPVPGSGQSTLSLRAADGTLYEVQAPWQTSYYVDPSLRPSTVRPGDLMGYVPHASQQQRTAQDADAYLFALGAPEPYFLTAPVVAQFGFQAAPVSESIMAKYGLIPAVFPEIFAARYAHQGKELLLIRIPDYLPASPELHVAAYRAILDEYDDVVDGLVIDQNNNPGGSIAYVESLFRLFIDEPQPRMVFAVNADRRWINALRSIAQFSTTDQGDAQTVLGYADLIEAAYDAGEPLSPRLPLPIGNGIDYTVAPDAQYQWPADKPVLLLINELAGSGGDAFPMLMTRSGSSKAFGNTTWGLGGNVEETTQLLYSGATLAATRSLFTSYRPDGNYTPEHEIENNGIAPTPGLEHEVTLGDFRAGFVGYVTGFSDAIVDMIDGP